MTVKGIKFVLFGILSLFLSALFLEVKISPESFMYAVRLMGYVMFAEFLSNSGLTKKQLMTSLLSVAVVTAVIGWIQYIFFPDLTAMKLWGWDDHYYRMVGSFLDPAFLGIVLVLGILLSIWNGKALISLFLTLTLAVTFSRASWLALVIGLGLLLVKRKQKLLVVMVVLTLLISIPMLPKPGGEGVNLQRINSIEQKLFNFNESLQIISKSPVIGVGLNNICNVKKSIDLTISQNSCSGLDNSYLFVVATTGVVGLILFTDFLKEIYQLTNRKNVLLFSSFLAIGFHGIFTPTLFYPWVLGWISVLIACNFSKEYKKQLKSS